MKKIFYGIFAAIFLLLLLVVPICTLWEPHLNVSFYEQRKLDSFPEITKSGVWDGSFFTAFESAFSDHVVLRNTLLKLDTQLNMILEKPVVNNVIINSDMLLTDYGFSYWDIGYIRAQADAVSKDYQALNEFILSYGGYFCFLGVPQQSTYFSAYYPPYMDSRLWHTTAIRTAFSDYMFRHQVPFINMYAIYDSQGHPTDYYAQTDHHFTYEGAYAAYIALLNKINADTNLEIPVMTREDLSWSILPNPFLGSANRKLYGLWPTKDKLEIAKLKNPISFTRKDNGEEVPSSIYALPGNDSEEVTYSVYMGGDIGETIIQTNRPGLKNALIFGDSYTNALETLFWTGFNETRSLDYRYYTDMTLRKYIYEYHPDVVICVRDESVFLSKTGNGDVVQ